MERKITSNITEPKLSNLLEILLKQNSDIYLWQTNDQGKILTANDRIIVELKSFSALTNEMVVKSKNSENKFHYNEGDVVRFSNYRSNINFETKVLKVHPHLLFLKKPKIINLEESRSSKRLNVSNQDITIRFTVRINQKAETLVAQVLDISPSGLGIICLDRSAQLIQAIGFGEKIELTQFNLQNFPLGVWGYIRYKQDLSSEIKKSKVKMIKVGIQMDEKVDIEDLILDFDWQELD
jgi:hypothetical protein